MINLILLFLCVGVMFVTYGLLWMGNLFLVIVVLAVICFCLIKFVDMFDKNNPK